MLGRQGRGLGVAVAEHWSGPGAGERPSVVKTARPPALALTWVVGSVLERRWVTWVPGHWPGVVSVEAREPLAIW